MRFVDAVRAREIEPPTSRSFSLHAWRRAAAAQLEDEADRRLAQAGEWLHDTLAEVRKRQCFVHRKDIDGAVKLRAIVGFANVAALEICNEFQENFLRDAGDRQTLLFDEFAQVKLTGAHGGSLPVDDVAESLGNCAQMALRFVMADSGAAAVSGGGRGRVQFDDVAADANLAGLYAALEGVWEQCLWEGYEIDVDATPAQIRPVNIEHLDRFIVTRHRQDRLAQDLIRMTSQHLKAGRAVGARTRPVVAIRRDERHQRLVLGRGDEPGWAGTLATALRVVVRQQVYADLWHAPSPAHPGLTLDAVLGAWEVVASTSEVLFGRLQQGRLPGRHLDLHAPLLHVPALVQAVREALDCPHAVATKLIEFLTYGGRRGQELWAQPLVRVARDRVAPVLLAARSAELRRVLDVWLVQLGLTLDEKGTVFEKTVRRVMVEAARGSTHLRQTQVIEGRFEFEISRNRKEEIDLVMVMGARVLVGETKCHVQPAAPREWRRHRRSVQHAARQAGRKCRAVEAHKGLFRAQLKRRGIELPEDFEVQPLVVLNSGLHAGVPCEGTPVVDLPMLETYFAGHLTHGLVEREDGTTEVLPELPLYASTEEAHRRLAAYLQAPAQLARLWACVQPVSFPMSLSSGEVLAIVHGREVRVAAPSTTFEDVL